MIKCSRFCHLMAVSAAIMMSACSPGGSGPDDNSDSLGGGDYGIGQTSASTFDVLGTEDPPMVDNPVFGPAAGYPNPQSVSEAVLGVRGRGG